MRIGMQRYGDQGWEFTVDGIEYRTDRNGDGLWQMLPRIGSCIANDNVFRQISRPCQFSLSGDRSRAYQQIRRGFVA